MTVAPSDDKAPAVSVMMPVYNAELYVGEAIRSILDQSFADFELIAIDDGSTDGSLRILEEYKTQDPRIRVFSRENRGLSATFNEMIALARGRYLACCDADDLYPTGRLKWQVNWLSEHRNHIAISGGFRTITEKGQPIADLACEGVGRDVTSQLLAGTSVTTHCAWLKRASAIHGVGGARTWFVTAEDLDLQCRLATRGQVWHEPRVAYLYRLHDESMIHNQSNTLREFYGQSAKRFAIQRAERGYDDLEAGKPPLPPKIDARDSRTTARDQGSSHLVGAAWRAHQRGARLEGICTMLRALRMRPYYLPFWKSLIMLVLKR